MRIITLQNERIFSSNCYILIDGNCACIIDPSVSYEDAVKKFPELVSLENKYVFLTHGHIDHIWGIESYANKGFSVMVSSEDGKKLSDRIANCSYIVPGDIDSYYGAYKKIYDGDEIDIGSERLKVIATPGHTSGSLSYLVNDSLFSGDTLFEGGGFGRCDLLTGSREDMQESLMRLFSLPDDITVYSGHGAPTKLKTTKEHFYNYIRREF